MAAALAELQHGSGPSVPPAPVVSPHEQSTAVKTVGAPVARSSEPEDDAAVAIEPALEDSGPGSIDEAAESAFLAEAKERGEVVRPRPADEVDETNPKKLPSLDDLVNRIPPDVREVLEDLFRARFVTVKKFPKRVMK